MSQFRPKITKIMVCTFEMSGKIPDSANVATEQVISTPSHTFSRYLAALAAKYLRKMMVLASLGLVTLVRDLESIFWEQTICCLQSQIFLVLTLWAQAKPRLHA